MIYDPSMSFAFFFFFFFVHRQRVFSFFSCLGGYECLFSLPCKQCNVSFIFEMVRIEKFALI